MIDFHQPPFPFLVGDRVHLRETPFCLQTMGTILSLDHCTNAPIAAVQWDDGGYSLWNTIALAPLPFRPAVMLKEDWNAFPAAYREVIERKGISQGYRSVLVNLGGTVLTPVVTRPEPLLFRLGCQSFLALDCVPLAPGHYVLLSHEPGACKQGDWSITHVRLIQDGGIVDASERLFFPSWQEAYRVFDRCETHFVCTTTAFLQRMKSLSAALSLSLQLIDDGYALDYGGGFVSKFRFGEEAKLEGLLSIFQPHEPLPLNI